PRPSTRISTLGLTLTDISAKRKTDPSRLSSLVRGELDWIVMKCLEKDGTRRYETANNLARDVQRYLADEPVEACPPSLTYRLSKVARRNKAPLAIAAAFITLLLSGVALSTWQAVRATTAESQSAASEEKAIANAKAAQDSEQIAKQERDSADREKINALAAKEELRYTLYASEMNLVQAAAESQQYARAAQLLERERPAAGQPDFRGFEWHYWQRMLTRRRLRSVEIPQLGSMNRVGSNTRIFSRDAARLAAIINHPVDSPSQTAFGGLVAIFDAVTGRQLVAPFDPFPDQQGRPWSPRRRFIAMSDDGTRIAAALGRFVSAFSDAEQPGRISIRDGETGSEIRSVEVPLNATDIALTADGSRIAVEYAQFAEPGSPRFTSGLAGVKIWDTSTGDLVQTLPLLPSSDGFSRILWSPDGARLLRQSVTVETIDNKRTFRELFQVVEVASGEKLWEREFPPHQSNARRAWAWSPNGKLLVIFELAEPGIAAKNNAQLWDSQSGATLAILDRDAPSLGGLNSTIGFSPDSQRLALAAKGNEIYVWDLAELSLASSATLLRIAKPHVTLQTAGEAILALAFSADGREVQSVDTGSSIVSWDATSREETGLGPDSMVEFFNAAISPDATKVAFSSGGELNPMCSVWDIVRNEEIFRSSNAGH
ncbi:MAG: WD40 repeat domain-containing protein, partial [Planctomycetia bacterium]|nr:WD40 repeat domain-containing protein [Planctomycetia bacterium]